MSLHLLQILISNPFQRTSPVYCMINVYTVSIALKFELPARTTTTSWRFQRMQMRRSQRRWDSSDSSDSAWNMLSQMVYRTETPSLGGIHYTTMRGPQAPKIAKLAYNYNNCGLSYYKPTYNYRGPHIAWYRTFQANISATWQERTPPFLKKKQSLWIQTLSEKVQITLQILANHTPNTSFQKVRLDP